MESQYAHRKINISTVQQATIIITAVFMDCSKHEEKADKLSVRLNKRNHTKDNKKKV